MDKNIINNIIAKTQMKIAVSKFNEEEVNLPKRNLFKLVATFMLVTTVTGSLVYATGNVIEKIWKKPESYTISQNLTEEEKAKCISEEEAKKIGDNYLKKIGFDEQTIKNLELSKSFFDYENVWSMSSEKVSMRIDAETGKIKSINIPTNQYKIPYNYGITREEARKVAKELLEKYRLENDTGEYELISLKRNDEKDEKAYIWYADFYRKYGDLINPAESIRIGWVPTINGLYSLSMESNLYENNEQKISQEEAIKIAIEKDNQIEKNKTIKSQKAEIRIKQMNEEVYLRENFKEEYENRTLNMEKINNNTYTLKKDAVIYKTEKRVRKVWCVVIYYNSTKDHDSYTYYIDSTTGEIIGGQMYDVLQNEVSLRNDPSNVIEK